MTLLAEKYMATEKPAIIASKFINVGWEKR